MDALVRPSIADGRGRPSYDLVLGQVLAEFITDVAPSRRAVKNVGSDSEADSWRFDGTGSFFTKILQPRTSPNLRPEMTEFVIRCLFWPCGFTRSGVLVEEM
ncbi:MAG TPA: hypothetical protein VK137_07950, partial [Planctomycetaceae bacterium]|nr:hypothetical protein [Planctomycetaceae bacterium]